MRRPNLLRAQVEAWLRVATAEDERVRRTATATELGAAAPQTQEPRKL